MLSSWPSLKVIHYRLLAFAAVTILAVFVPLNPVMPGIGPDPSWMFAINEAVARHLRFGRDIAFTFGSYASIYSREPKGEEHLHRAGFRWVAAVVRSLFAHGHGLSSSSRCGWRRRIRDVRPRGTFSVNVVE